MVRRHPSTRRRKPQHKSRTLASTAPNPNQNSCNRRREHLALQPGFRGSNTSRNSFIVWAARASSNSYWGFARVGRSKRRTEDSRMGRKIAGRSTISRARVEIRQSGGTVSINLPVSQTSGASLLCCIDLPSISLQVPVAQWGTRFSSIKKMRLLFHHFGNEARKKWPVRSHVPCIWLTRLSLMTDDSPARHIHWPRKSSGKPSGSGCLLNWAISPTR